MQVHRIFFNDLDPHNLYPSVRPSQHFQSYHWNSFSSFTAVEDSTNRVRMHHAGPYEGAVKDELVGQFEASCIQDGAFDSGGYDDDGGECGLEYRFVAERLSASVIPRHITSCVCHAQSDDRSAICFRYLPTSPSSSTSPTCWQVPNVASFMPPSFAVPTRRPRRPSHWS
ncbi:hypothetical protein Hypma_014585 [Hypsizygus marmoreus]|uniref:Uncharacterized protein n=1 Tax=Hypsizygus marmoreus TaxID=39966 RepID=A0A369J9R8_HYPMA|nr:hypothetical protein Hypma_014585 [Hypsizygus marmoreus]